MEEGQSASAEVEEEVELLENVDGFQLMPDRLYFRVFYCFCTFIGSIKFPRSRDHGTYNLQVLTKTCPTTLSPSPHHTYFAFYTLKTRRVSILCGMRNAEFRPRIICGISDAEKIC